MTTARAARWRRGTGLLLMIGSMAGCGTGIGSRPARQLDANAFVAPDAAHRRDNVPLDSGSPLLYDNVRLELGAPPDERADSSGSREISKTVRESVRPPGQAAASAVGHAGANGPSTRPQASPSVGTYIQLGGVLAQVNGTAIYADKVLAVLQRPLEAEARKLDEGHFKEDAARLVQNQVMEYIHAELEFAAAQRNLEAKDEGIARAETTQWRQRQVTKAGGSIEVARRKALEDGTDFEETVRQHYRLVMTQLYYQRKVFPLIQVSAADLRQYYDANKEKEFTESAEARFSLIKIGVEQTGGREAALTKAKQIYERARGGEDFSKLAHDVNDDAWLMKQGGDVGWMKKGAFRLEKVEDAAWQLRPGEISTAVDTGDAFYLVKLNEKKGGRVQKFEEQAVQDHIRDTLRKEQFNALRDKVRRDLESKAVISMNPEMMNTALEMVMQQYPRWVGAVAN